MNKTVKLLIDVARAAHAAADNAEEGCADEVVLLDKEDYKALCEALDRLEELPEISGFAATGPAKAEHQLKNL